MRTLRVASEMGDMHRERNGDEPIHGLGGVPCLRCQEAMGAAGIESDDDTGRPWKVLGQGPAGSVRRRVDA